MICSREGGILRHLVVKDSIGEPQSRGGDNKGGDNSGVLTVVFEQIGAPTDPQGVCVYIHYHAWPQSYDHGPSHPYNAGTEHVGFSLTRPTSLARSAKRGEVSGESHEG